MINGCDRRPLNNKNIKMLKVIEMVNQGLKKLDITESGRLCITIEDIKNS